MTGLTRRLKRRGYTLMEMLLVQGVIVSLVAMSWPALSGSLDKNRLLAAAKQVRIELLKARLDAIETGVPRQFRYLPGEGRFETRVGLMPIKDDDARSLLRSASNAGLNQANPDEAEHSNESASEIGAVHTQVLDEGMTFAPIVSTKADDEHNGANLSKPVLDQHDECWSAPIVVYPNGRASNARIRLLGPRDFYVDVTLRGLTGSVAISDLQRRNEDSE